MRYHETITRHCKDRDRTLRIDTTPSTNLNKKSGRSAPFENVQVRYLRHAPADVPRYALPCCITHRQKSTTGMTLTIGYPLVAAQWSAAGTGSVVHHLWDAASASLRSRFATSNFVPPMALFSHRNPISLPCVNNPSTNQSVEGRTTLTRSTTAYSMKTSCDQSFVPNAPELRYTPKFHYHPRSGGGTHLEQSKPQGSGCITQGCP